MKWITMAAALLALTGCGGDDRGGGTSDCKVDGCPTGEECRFLGDFVEGEDGKRQVFECIAPRAAGEPGGGRGVCAAHHCIKTGEDLYCSIECEESTADDGFTLVRSCPAGYECRTSGANHDCFKEE